MSISEAPDDATLIAQKIVQFLNEAETSPMVAELYVKGCEALWTNGTPKPECGAKFAKIIRDLKYPDEPNREWHSGYYWETVKGAGFTRSSNPTPAKEQKISSRLLLEDPTTWIESPFYKERLPLIQFLQEDMAITQQMIVELQRNFEQRERKDGTKEDDPENPRDWRRLFSSTDVFGNITPYAKEEIQDYLATLATAQKHFAELLMATPITQKEEAEAYQKLLIDLRVKLHKMIQRCMDERRAMMPWMIWQLKLRGNIISKAYWGKQYYVMFKRKDTLTPKKLTQFEQTKDTVAEYLNWVATDSWKFGYCEFIPCPHCIDPSTLDAKEKEKWDPNKPYLLEMYPLENGTWKWHCANCDRFWPPGLLKSHLEAVANSANGLALIYLERKGMPVPENTEVLEDESDDA